MRVLVIQHDECEGLGAIDTWLTQRNLSAKIVLRPQGELFPDLTSFDFLIIMGGPQSPATVTAGAKAFNGPQEVAFIQRAIAANKKVLGICLGAQMISTALGGGFGPSPHKELGVFPICLTPAAKTDPFFAHCPAQFPVAHWHDDMAGVPVGTQVLAQSEGCPNQILCYSDKVYGFQCHMEFNRSTIELMSQESSASFEDAGKKPFVQTKEEFLAQDFTVSNQIIIKFLDYMLAL